MAQNRLPGECCKDSFERQKILLMKIVANSCLALAFFTVLLNLASCGGADDPDPQDPDETGELKVTSLSPALATWDDVITVNGTGFSTTPSLNEVYLLTLICPPVEDYGTLCNLDYNGTSPTRCRWRCEVVSATATQLTIRVPYCVRDEGRDVVARGPQEYGKVLVINKEKESSLSESSVSLFGRPKINFVDAYIVPSKDSPPDTYYGVRPGTEVQMGINWVNHYTYTPTLKLTIDGKEISLTPIPNGYPYNYKATLPKTLMELGCQGGEAQLAGRDVKVYATLDDYEPLGHSNFVLYNYPTYSIHDKTYYPQSVSKLAGGNPRWVVTGIGMFYTHATFTPLCGGQPVIVPLVDPNLLRDEIEVYFPLVEMVANCTYTVRITTLCETNNYTKVLGNISITP